MILPLRVFGRSGVKMIVLGRAMAPIWSATCLRSTSPWWSPTSTSPRKVT